MHQSTFGCALMAAGPAVEVEQASRWRPGATRGGAPRDNDHGASSAAHEIERMPWVGPESATREVCVAIMNARSFLPPHGSLVRAAINALVVLDLAAGRYETALGLLHEVHQEGPDGRVDVESLPDMVEAGVRGGDRPFAVRALSRLEIHVLIEPTAWGLGVLARSRALEAADGADAERLYRRAISHLTDSEGAADVARAHLLFGEWLRRRARRIEARSHLRVARDLFFGMGAGAFGERVLVELAATGERARRRSAESRNALTCQELRISNLAAAHATNREIGQQLFISTRTVEYHLLHVFQKLQISSRRQLPNALAQMSTVTIPHSDD